jgi:hypothetical protein
MPEPPAARVATPAIEEEAGAVEEPVGIKGVHQAPGQLDEVVSLIGLPP